ncbi:hypothetical protein [Glutamicibacter sp. FBE19]|uniref:hypothetical protein n=1 Tax=Glutamicibacter sp. FBE19 TaxID=2761534 RepID=UPI0018969EF7|nr:hypothetical protein [Glutamicibacter sp. FBE19]MBF6671141.1 hypothetical protein [Glutamicibacter sp. FBE19]
MKKLPNGHVVIEPRMRVSPRGKDLSWLVVYTFAVKRPLSFFFIGRNGNGGKLNFGMKQLSAAADLVIIEGCDFVDYMGMRGFFGGEGTGASLHAMAIRGRPKWFVSRVWPKIG